MLSGKGALDPGPSFPDSILFRKKNILFFWGAHRKDDTLITFEIKR
jgi:hypothetical protein